MSDDGLYLRGETWYVNRRHRGRRIRCSLRTADRAEAERASLALLGEIRKPDSKDNGQLPARYAIAESDELWQCVIRCRERAIKRDKVRGRGPTISPDELRAIFARAAGRCELTGIAFSLQALPGKLRRPFAPSLDRIDNSAAYTATNVRIVCVAANYALNEWGETVFRRLAVGYLTRTVGTSNGHNGADQKAKSLILQEAPVAQWIEQPPPKIPL